MNLTYPCVQVDGKYYLLSDEEPKDGDNCYILNRNNRIGHCILKADFGKELLRGMKGKIIASENQNLPLPYISWPDEDEEAAKQYAYDIVETSHLDKNTNLQEWNKAMNKIVLLKSAFIAGRKSSTKKFDEKDVLIAIEKARLKDSFGNRYKYIPVEIIQSLTPEIVSVEVEAEIVSGFTNDFKNPPTAPKLFTDEKGKQYVKVTKINYKK